MPGDPRAAYRIDVGDARRGHEQRGRRLGLALSPTSMPWNVATVIPTSTTAQPAVFRPALQIDGQLTRLLVDQIRSVDTTYIHGDPVCHLDHDELAEVEHAAIRYLGLSQHPTLRNYQPAKGSITARSPRVTDSLSRSLLRMSWHARCRGAR